MKRLVNLCCMAFIALACAAESSAKEPIQIADEYFGTLVSGDVEKALNRLMQHSMLDETKPGEIELLKGRVSEALRLFGKPKGFENIRSKEFGKSLKQLLYLSLHSHLPMIWELTFYKTDDSWQLINIQMRDNLDLLR